ncbi:MAG: histidine kinase, partial [Bacteroidota bacterium]
MKARLQRIREYLSGNNAWLYVLPMVVMALIWVKESDVKNWKVFLLSLLFGGFFFGSALWRAWRKDQQTSSNSKLGWWISVVVLPTVLMLSLVGISRGDWGFFYFWSYGMGVLLAIEGFQYFQQVRAWSFNWAAWVARFNLEVAILVVLVVLAGFIPFTYNPLQEHLRDVPFSQSWPTYALYSLKIFGVLLLFYGYYFLNHYVLIPALLQKRGLAYYLLGLVLSLLVLYPLTGEIIHRLLADDLIQSTLLTGNVFTTDGYFFAPLLVILATLPFIITYRLLLQQQELNLLKKEKTTTELNWLKQQINPHFFFNTLNNLYALSLTKDEQTPEVILQLSELMRYVI